MSAEPGSYGGYGLRPQGPGSARHWMDPLHMRQIAAQPK